MNNEMDKNNVYLSGAEVAASRAVEQARMELAEENRKRKVKLIKFGSMMVAISIILVFATRSWFTMSREVGGTGASMSTNEQNFVLSSLTGDGADRGKWYDPYHKKIMGDEAENDDSESTKVWLMTEGKNFGNYGNSVGIKPGSFGTVSFKVTPLIEEIDLDFSFSVIGYHSSDSIFNDESEDEDEDSELSMTPVCEMGDKGALVSQYLYGHILLFENRTPVYETIVTTDPETGEETTTNTSNILRYNYSGLIETDEDLNRVLKDSAKNHFTGKDTVIPVDIYWIWPNTLSNLIDITGREDVHGIPICTGADLTKVTQYVLDNPQYFLKGYTASSSNDDDDDDDPENGGSEEQSGGENGSGENAEETVSGSSLTLADIIADYELYGDMYDMADNDIGMNVNYILLKLTAMESTTNTNGGSDNNGDNNGNGEGQETPEP